MKIPGGDFKEKKTEYWAEAALSFLEALAVWLNRMEWK